MREHLRPALAALAVFTLLCGVVYPLALYVVARAIPSPVSELVGRRFEAPGEFWGRPSAAAYHAMSSSGTNLGPSNPALAEAVAHRIAVLHAADPTNHARIPIDLVTASASGLDPHISPAAAYYQVSRVARVRGLAPDRVKSLVDAAIEERTFRILGDRRVNVVRLNRSLDGAH